jgi:heme/copper-type cytochrome/quinol oxidase subunit 2
MVPIEGRQLAVLVLWIALSLIVITVFAWVVQSTRHPREFNEVQTGGYRLRRGWGWLYGSLLIISFAATVWTMPYAWAQEKVAKSPALTVEVVAHQFAFTMPSRLPAHRLIKFVVWAISLIFVPWAWPHHLYMDFVQAPWLQTSDSAGSCLCS